MEEEENKRATRTSKEMWDLWVNDELEMVDKELDDTWRHGNYVSVVVKDADGRFWAGFYRESADGEYNSWRDGEPDDWKEVFAHVEIIEKIHYK